MQTHTHNHLNQHVFTTRPHKVKHSETKICENSLAQHIPTIQEHTCKYYYISPDPTTCFQRNYRLQILEYIPGLSIFAFPIGRTNSLDNASSDIG